MTGQSDMFKQRLLAISIGAWVLLSACTTLLGADSPAPATAPTTTAPVVLSAPDPAKFRVWDRPSDDGSALIVEWAKPEEQEAKGVSYVIEIARSPEDFAAKKFKSIPFRKKVTKEQKKRYLAWTRQYVSQFSEADEPLYYLQVMPSNYFPPDPPAKLGPQRVDELRGDDRLTDEQAERAKTALVLETVEKGRLSAKRIGELVKAGRLNQERATWAYAAFLRARFDEGKLTTERSNKLLEEGRFTQAQADLAVAIMARGKLEDEQTTQRVKELVAGVELRADRARDAKLAFELKVPDAAPAVRLLENLLGDNVLSEDQAKQATEIVKEFRAPGGPMVRLAGKLLEDKTLPAAQADLARMILRSRKPDQMLSDQEQSDRAWFERFRTFLTKSDQKRQKELHREVNSETYYFRLAATDGKRRVYAARDGEPVVVSAAAETNLFKGYKLNNLLFALVFSGTIVAFIQIARRNPNLFIRKIAGLEAVEEAIGRATEMGRSVFFVHGLGVMQQQGTIAAVTVLARVARRAAEYDTRVKVMNTDAIVTAVSQEVVQQAYTEAGRPDSYDPDDVSLVAATQFSYAAAVSGRMVRERPAAVFLMGSFAAESLLLAETGASTGAIQIAGTDAFTQLPFFITTCDYTLIGEELYAASAYLSREPKMLGSLRGQDIGKAFLMAVIVIGAIVLTLKPVLGNSVELFKNLFEPF